MAVTYNIKGTTNPSFKIGKKGVVLSPADNTSETTLTIPNESGTAALLESTQTFTGAITFNASGNSVLVSDTLRIAQSGSGLRMTNVGAFDNDGSDNFRIYGTNNLYLRANGENGSGLSIDSANQDVTIDNNLIVSGNLTVQGTTTTVNSTEVNVQNAFVFEGVTADDFETTLTVTDPTADRTITLPDATGTVALTSDLTSYITASSTDTLTNKTLGATTISGHLTPSANVTYDLGTSSNRFRDIYLAGTTIDLGGAKISNDGSNNLDIKDGDGNRKTLRASSIELVDSNGKIMKLERDASSGKLKQSRKNSDGSDEGSTDTIDIVGDTSPQLGGNLDTNGNDINFGDNDKAQFGTSNDLAIYHDGSQSIIEDVGTGQLKILAENTLHFGSATGTETYIRALKNGTVELYYDNSKKLETTSTGATVTGTLVADGLTIDTDTLYVDSTNNRVGIGTTSPSYKFDVSGNARFNSTGAIVLPVGTTAQRPDTPVVGMFRFNSTIDRFEGYNGSSWVTLGHELATADETDYGSITETSSATYNYGLITDGDTILVDYGTIV